MLWYLALMNSAISNLRPHCSQIVKLILFFYSGGAALMFDEVVKLIGNIKERIFKWSCKKKKKFDVWYIVK